VGRNLQPKTSFNASLEKMDILGTRVCRGPPANRFRRIGLPLTSYGTARARRIAAADSHGQVRMTHGTPSGCNREAMVVFVFCCSGLCGCKSVRCEEAIYYVRKVAAPAKKF
jgi:hypothetical protein